MWIGNRQKKKEPECENEPHVPHPTDTVTGCMRRGCDKRTRKGLFVLWFIDVHRVQLAHCKRKTPSHQVLLLDISCSVVTILKFLMLLSWIYVWSVKWGGTTVHVCVSSSLDSSLTQLPTVSSKDRFLLAPWISQPPEVYS